jgi:hypothetical protein
VDDPGELLADARRRNDATSAGTGAAAGTRTAGGTDAGLAPAVLDGTVDTVETAPVVEPPVAG